MTIEERAGTRVPAEGIVREATREDLPRIVELLDQLRSEPGHENVGQPVAREYTAAFDEIEADGKQHLFVLEVDGVVLGTLVLIIVPNLTHHGRPYAIVENVVVDASARGSGYGERLMRPAIDEARAAGCYKIALTSGLHRAEAHRFYERLGFRTTQRSFRIDL